MAAKADKPNKRGAPTKRSEAAEREIIRLLKNGNTRKTAAEVVGIDPSTLWRWCQISARFRKAVTQAEANAVSLYVNALTSNAVSGDTKAIIFYLTHRHGDDWKPAPTQTRIGGDPDNPAAIVVERVVFKGE